MAEPTLIVEAAFAGGASTGLYLHLDDSARGLLDTAQLGPEDGVWEDITDYVHRVRIRRGATQLESPIPRYEAGTAVISLDNSDRRFDPTNLDGPYVSGGVTQVTPMRAVRVMAVWDGVTYHLYRGFADEWRIDYNGPNYSLCELFATDGTKVLANNDRTAVGAVGAGEDTGARISRILDSAEWSETDRIIATGDTTVQATTLADNSWTEILLTQDTEFGEVFFDPQGRVVFRNRHAVMEELRSTSAVARFGDNPDPDIETTINLADNPSMELGITGWGAGGTVPPTLSHSSAQARFGTDSLLITWGTGGVTPNAAYTTTTPVEVGRTYTVSCYVYVPTGSPDVILNFDAVFLVFGDAATAKDQWVRISVTSVALDTSLTVYVWPTSSPSAGQTCYVDGIQIEDGSTPTTYVDGDQASSEWDGAAHASTSRRLPELPYADVTLDYTDQTIANVARVTRVGGAEQVAEDTSSIELNLQHVFRRTDLSMQTDAVALDFANFIVYQAADPELRFSQLTIRPRRDEDQLFPQVLGREFGDRIRVIRRPPGGGTISREVFVRGVEHHIAPMDWTTTWSLQSATRWAFLILDHATLGTLDENALAY
jgi:hypothetical protein